MRRHPSLAAGFMLALALALPASAQEAPGLGARLPDAAVSGWFDGKNGGTFGANTKTTLPKSNKVAIAGFNVTYVLQDEAKAQVRSSYFLGRDNSGATARLDIGLDGVDDATLQAITDRAYALFVEQLTLAGREVVPLEQVRPYWPEFATVPAAERDGSRKTFAPSGWPRVTDTGLGGIKSLKALQRLSYESGQALVIVPQLEVHFASMSSSGNKSGLIARRAEVGADLAMHVTRFDTTVRHVTKFDKWGMKGGDEGAIWQTREFGTEREFAKLVDEDSSDNSASKAVFDSLGKAAGLLNAGGPARSRTVLQARTTNKAYALAAIDVLDQATGAFAKLMAENPAPASP